MNAPNWLNLGIYFATVLAIITLLPDKSNRKRSDD